MILLRVRADRLPRRPSEMRVGQPVRVRARMGRDRRPYERLPELSTNARRALAAVPSVECDGERLVAVDGPTVRTRQLLLAAVARVPDEPELPALVRAIDRLWRRGATPLIDVIDVIDVTGIRQASTRGYTGAIVDRVGDGSVDLCSTAARDGE